LTPAFRLAEAAAPRADARGFGRRKRADVEFLLCDPSKDARACGLVQSAAERAAPAASSASARYASTRAHLRRLATECLELISGRDCAALDIGCNDGALLSYYPRWVDRYGVDPSEHVDGVGDWAWTQREAFPSPALDRAFGGKLFDIITAANVLEEVDAPRAFLKRVKSLLAPDGVFALETLYAPMTLMRAGVEQIVSGASALYSLAALERALRDAGLKIFRGALTDKEGGSIRLFATHEENADHDFDPWYERLARLWDEENALALRMVQPYQAFERRATDARAQFSELLNAVRDRGERVFLIGAGAPSAALLHWAGGAQEAVSAVVDEGFAEGARLLGGPQIINENEARAIEPDYFLAPASLKREALERWREAILLGAQIIVATPAPHVVSKHNFAAELAKTLAVGDAAGEVETLRAILAAAGKPRLVAVSSDKKAVNG
jgi:SAM-dependent methyltransferase